MSDMLIQDFMALDAALGSEKAIEEQGTSTIAQISADTPITAQITEELSADTPITAQITEDTFNTHSKVKRSEIEDFTALDAALGGIQSNLSSNIEATPVNLNIPSPEQEIGEKEKGIPVSGSNLVTPLSIKKSEIEDFTALDAALGDMQSNPSSNIEVAPVKLNMEQEIGEKEKGIPISESNLVTPLSIKKSEIEDFTALDAALGAISKEKEDTEPTGKSNDEALFIEEDDEVESPSSAPEVRDDEALFLGGDDEVELSSSAPTFVANSNQGASEATVIKNEPIPAFVPDAEDNHSQKDTELASDKREPSKKTVLSGQTALDRAFSAIQQGAEPEWTPATEFDNLLAACLVKKKGTSEGLNSSLALIEMPELDSVPIKSRISASRTAFASFRQLMELSSNPNVTDDSAIAWLFALAAASSGTSVTKGDYKAAYHAVLDGKTDLTDEVKDWTDVLISITSMKGTAKTYFSCRTWLSMLLNADLKKTLISVCKERSGTLSSSLLDNLSVPEDCKEFFKIMSKDAVSGISQQAYDNYCKFCSLVFAYYAFAIFLLFPYKNIAGEIDSNYISERKQSFKLFSLPVRTNITRPELATVVARMNGTRITPTLKSTIEEIYAQGVFEYTQDRKSALTCAKSIAYKGGN